MKLAQETMKVLCIDTDININKLSKQVLTKEVEIIKKYSPLGGNGEFTDGQTGLGENSLTSRFFHFNVLNWLGTKSLRKWIRKGYEAYTGIKGTTLYVQCWANVMRRGEQIQSHKHCSYNDRIITSDRHLCGHLNVQVDGLTSTYYGGNPILNEKKTMVFFPNNVLHWKDRCDNDKERITIAFDVYSKEYFKYDIFDYAKNHWVRI